MEFDLNDIESIMAWEKQRIIEQTVLTDGRFLSTVMIPSLGMSEGFESMLFDDPESMKELGCWRWTTKEEAAAGHKAILEELRHEELTIELSGLGVVNE